jgi:hypothetical protein
MKSKIGNEEEKILKWYLIIKEQHKSSEPFATWIRRNGYDTTLATNMNYRIFHIEKNQPKEYARRMKLVDEFHASRLSLKVFAESKGIKRTIIADMKLHLRYKDIIERLTEESGNPKTAPNSIIGKMKFLEIKKTDPIPEPEYEPEQNSPIEVIHPKNDIEINISLGVKVIVSPNVDTTRLIKIIELLKDL